MDSIPSSLSYLEKLPKRNKDLQATQILKCSVLHDWITFIRLTMISVVFQNKGHLVDRAEEKLHCLAQALFLKKISFPSYVTTANPVEQILGVEAEGIKINFDHSKYFC